MRKTRFEQIPVSVVRNIIAAQLAEEEGAMSVRVLIADDSEIVRRSIVGFLKDQSNIEIVGQASSFAEVLELTAALKPDVLLMDVHMTDGAKDREASVRCSLPRPQIPLWLCRYGTTMKRRNSPRTSARACC